MVTLDAVLAARGMTLTELSSRVGLTLANLSVLKTGRARAIRFSTLEAICRELDCQPADLLSFRPDGAAGAEEPPAAQVPGDGAQR
nr:helix-turn-helix transcriptional regulator [Pseudonocardia sp. KRD291]